MDYKYINQLLDRYWRGETSLEEEQILRAFFSQICVPDELAKYRPLFVYEQSEPKVDRLDDDFDERMMSMIGETHEVEARRIKISQRFAPLFKAAAMVAIVLALSQAAQISFQTTEPGVGANQSYVPRQGGVSVAMSDSARIDTLRKANADASQQASGHEAVMLK